MKSAKKRISVTLDANILEKIKICAKENDRSISRFVNWILRERLKDDSHNKNNK
ncbi:MAG: toxin-antitoxin system protein [Clostridiales bacterium]|nr:toxin-antitoxin system protein [Clostridiales bacterium]